MPMAAWRVSGISNPKGLAQRLRRQGYTVNIQGRDVASSLLVVGEGKPWASLRGYTTTALVVREVPIASLPALLRQRLPLDCWDTETQ